MSIIRLCLLAGAALYISIFLIQGTIEGGVLIAAIIGVLILLGLGSRLFISDERSLQKREMILLWCSLLTFALYGLLKAGGII